MVRRAAVALAFSAAVTFAAIAPAPAQQAAEDAAAGAPDQTACVGQSLGSVCSSSPTIPSGTCHSGCCCHYLTSPEGAEACAPCLACSDTSFDDPGYTAGPCDAGVAASPDSGAVVDAAIPVAPTGGGDTPAASGCACSNAGAPIESAPPLAGLLLGLALFARRLQGRRPPA